MVESHLYSYMEFYFVGFGVVWGCSDAGDAKYLQASLRLWFNPVWGFSLDFEIGPVKAFSLYYTTG